jgi:hypothetical protein
LIESFEACYLLFKGVEGMQRGLEDLKVLGVEGTVEKWLWKEVVGGRKERRDRKDEEILLYSWVTWRRKFTIGANMIVYRWKEHVGGRLHEMPTFSR